MEDNKEVSRRICFILGSYYKFCRGGAELQAHYIATALVRDGWDVHYIYADHSSNKNALEEIIDNGIKLHCNKIFDFGRFGRAWFLSYFQLRKQLIEIDPDIIYVRSALAYSGMVSSYAKKYKKKYIIAISSIADCMIDKIGNLYSSRSILAKLNQKLAQRGIKNADQIIAQSKEQANLLKTNFGMDSVIIENGHTICSEALNKNKPPIVLWISNIKKIKQPHLFVDLANACKDIEAKFVIVGRRGNRKFQVNLESKISKLSNIDYIGELEFDKVNELLNKASVLVNTSVVEGTPNTFIQAWMRNVPTISLNSDPDSVIKEKKLGFHSNDSAQLALDTRRLLYDEDLRTEMGNNAREYAVTNHNLEKTIPKNIDLFESLLNEKEA